VDLNRRRVIPGLNDSHLHVIRGGLYYNLELRWDGVPTIAQALMQLKEQADRTPPPQWVRVVGGWNEWQFKDGRMPSIDEINAAAPDTPVFVMHLYDSAILNRAALSALGFSKRTPNPPGGLVARDRDGTPSGLLIAEPNALVLYSAIAKAPKLGADDQRNSSRHFMRELNRFGVTSVSDAGGGGQNYPDDYKIIKSLHDENQLTLRIAYSLFAQKPGKELDDYTRWIGMTNPGTGSDFLQVNGAGENLLWAAADFENFLQPRPDLKPAMESELETIVHTLADANWPWRIHATYDETISRFLDVFERVHNDRPINNLGWFLDHGETISRKNLERVQRLGGGLAIQHRMAYQGEYFVRRYGVEQAKARPPIRQMLEMGLPVGGGTDGTRVASYHPWTSIWWMVSGKTVGGTVLHDKGDRLSRKEALERFTVGSAWFSREQGKKGKLSPGYYADLAVLDADYFDIEEDEIRRLESILTIVGGRIVHGQNEFKPFDPPLPPASPNWSPTEHFRGYDNSSPIPHKHDHEHTPIMGADGRVWETGCGCGV
ncbi:MAG: amidohydrolase, partial [Pseudomonadota bacterium]